METSKNWNTWNKNWKYPKIEQFGFSLQYGVLMKQIEWQTVNILIGLLLKVQSGQGLHCFVSPICPNT